MNFLNIIKENMNILIITTYYAPDTAIAAIRPTMFAKYLSKCGHNVTVLRSGLINCTADEFYRRDKNIRIISYYGENAPAELFERKELINISSLRRSRIWFLPLFIRRRISDFYKKNFAQIIGYRKAVKLCSDRLILQKRIIDDLKEETFDIVFSTYGEIENAYAGEYASKLFGCKWIMDFRDPYANKELQPKYVYKKKKKIQEYFVKNADVCTCVSNGLAQELSEGMESEKIHVLYNGYDPVECDRNLENRSIENTFSICYTGNLYSLSIEASTALFEALGILYKNKRINISNVKFVYAGSGGENLKSIAERHGVGSIFDDRGYVGKNEIERIQAFSDEFLVLSWNSKRQKGALSGKFYEGIRAGKPILSLISGDVPGSELYDLNQKYNYGFCYEIQNQNQSIEDLCDYIETMYNKKIKDGKIDFMHSEEFKLKFRYDNLTKELEELCINLINEDNINQ